MRWRDAALTQHPPSARLLADHGSVPVRIPLNLGSASARI